MTEKKEMLLIENNTMGSHCVESQRLNYKSLYTQR